MKGISKNVTKKLLAGLLTLAMICGIWPTHVTVNAETTPFETVVYDYSRADIGTSHMFFATAEDDGKYTGSDMFYNAVTGGIYVNEILYTTVTFRRNGGRLS